MIKVAQPVVVLSTNVTPLYFDRLGLPGTLRQSSAEQHLIGFTPIVVIGVTGMIQTYLGYTERRGFEVRFKFNSLRPLPIFVALPPG